MALALAEMTEAESAEELLSRELHSKMEHLFPSNRGGWEDITEIDREDYRACVEWLLIHGDLVEQALADRRGRVKARQS